MPTSAIDPLLRTGPMLLLGGMVLLFACSRLLPPLLTQWLGAISGRAVGHFIPIAIASIGAMFMGYPGIAVGIVFGTSVGAMTTAVGFVAVAEPIGEGPQRWRRLWGFVLAAALLVFVAGFKGDFRWRDALVLFVEGTVILMLWCEERVFHPSLGATLEKSLHSVGVPIAFPADDLPEEPADSPPNSLVAALEFVLAVAAIGLASWLAVQGIVRTTQLLQQPVKLVFRVSGSGLAASVLSLAMVLPMSYGVWRLAANGRAWQPMTTQVAILTLNLCVLLPILIMIPYLAVWIPGGTHWGYGSFVWGEGIPRFLLFPAANWRIDNVILIVVGILLLPVSFGKWALGREEGLILIAGYFFYLTAVLALG